MKKPSSWLKVGWLVFRDAVLCIYNAHIKYLGHHHSSVVMWHIQLLKTEHPINKHLWYRRVMKCMVHLIFGKKFQKLFISHFFLKLQRSYCFEDFFFFLSRHQMAQELISHDVRNNTFNYKHTFSVTIVPVCKVSYRCHAC